MSVVMTPTVNRRMNCLFSKTNGPFIVGEIIGLTSIYAVYEILTASEHILCNTVSKLCQDNATFVVDTSKLDHKSDVTGDDNGVVHPAIRPN